MTHYKMSDPAYWESPGKFAELDCVIPSMKHTYFVLGDVEREEGQAALVMKMKPGHVINSHAHASSVFEVVVEGSIEVDGTVYGPGDIMMLKAGEPCGRGVVGPEGCTTVEFFSTVQGAYNLIYEGADGEKIHWNSLERRGRPGTEQLKA